MKRVAACALALLVLALAAPQGFADLDTGMEGLWTGPAPDGTMTLLLGSGGTYISIYRAGETYRQAGIFTLGQDDMYLTSTDGTESTLRYGFSEGSLFLSADGDEVELKRQDFETQDAFPGVWVVDGGAGLIAMDASGGFASVDVGSGEAEKGIYLPDQGDLLIAFQDCTALQMAYQMDEADGSLTLTNADTGQALRLTRYAPPDAE